MKEKYVAPVFNLVAFEPEDILASLISVGGTDEDDRDAVIVW
ncbi:MAG: hypothetical protein ACI4K6_08295 [Candidatus Fimenecus sp.]